ncbi:MAG: hypothetical protein ABI818_21160, partial [Acidobacteriota bacterium]
AAPAFAQMRTARTPVVRDFASELGCGVTVAATEPVAAIRLAPRGPQEQHNFGVGDVVVLDAGETKGLKVGQEYFVRRAVPDPFTARRSDGRPSLTIHTAGWVRLVEVLPGSAIASVSHSCDAMEVGDYLEPFEMPAVPATATAGEPDFENPGRLVLGDERRQTAAPGDMLVLDRGSDHGVRPGQRVTFFRPAAFQGGPNLTIGHGTAMTVNAETTTIRVDQSQSAIFVGDLVALHR